MGRKGSCRPVMGRAWCVTIWVVRHAVKAKAGVNRVLQTAQWMLIEDARHDTARHVHTGVP